MGIDWVQFIPNKYLVATLEGAFSLLLIAGGFMARATTKRIKKATGQLDHMATNCVPTIQRNTAETNRLLNKLVEQNFELNGYLKAKAEDGRF